MVIELILLGLILLVVGLPTAGVSYAIARLVKVLLARQSRLWWLPILFFLMPIAGFWGRNSFDNFNLETRRIQGYQTVEKVRQVISDCENAKECCAKEFNKLQNIRTGCFRDINIEGTGIYDRAEMPPELSKLCEKGFAVLGTPATWMSPDFWLLVDGKIYLMKEVRKLNDAKLGACRQ